jgi:nickel superoxide dismutase
MVNKKFILAAVSGLAVAMASMAYSHCQIPCGIYDDKARLNSIAEHITTIEKSMKTITELSGQEKPNWNQLVRWINNKDEHANELDQIVTYYFMTQRIKPAEKSDAAAYEKYVKQLTLLHQMLVYSMKSKQTTDLANVEKLRELLKEFNASYLDEKAGEH